LAREFLGPVLREQPEKITRDLGADASAQQAQRRARPLGVAQRQEWQGGEPLARIIDDPGRGAPRGSRKLTPQPSPAPGRAKTHLRAQPPPPPRPPRPRR